MVGPDVLVEIDVGTMGLRDFHQLDEAVRAGRRAAEAALAGIFDAIESSNESAAPAPPFGDLIFDPMCEMVITAGLARATLDHKGRTIYFCSANCRDEFARGLHRLDDASTRR
jgi:YHS domain-containing protein